MEGLYESATMKKKDGTRFKGDTDTLVREVGKVMLDLSTSVKKYQLARCQISNNLT